MLLRTLTRSTSLPGPSAFCVASMSPQMAISTLLTPSPSPIKTSAALPRQLEDREITEDVRTSTLSPSPDLTRDLVPSASYHFSDGNILIQVESTLYKVHRSLISQAKVLEGMLGDSSGACHHSSRELPLFALADKAQDFGVFLRAIYHGMTFTDDIPTLSETRSLLFLSNKYDHAPMYAWASRTYASRCLYERALVSQVKPSSAWTHDFAFPPMTAATFAGLLSVADEFHLYDLLGVWVYQHVAEMPVEDRAEAMKLNGSVVGSWEIKFGTQTVLEILRRSDQISLLACLAFRDCVSSTTTPFHALPTCPPGSICRQTGLMTDIRNAFGVVLADQAYPAFLVDAKKSIEKGASRTNLECYELAMGWYQRHWAELSEKRAEPLALLPT